jgi:hypothetical protein
MQHSLRLRNYSVPTWLLMVHIRACFVRSNLKYASGSKVSRTKSGVKSCEKKSDIILRLATCCYGIKSVRRNDGNYLIHHWTQVLWAGRGEWGCNYVTKLFFFPTRVSYLSFLHSFPTSFTYRLSSQFLPFPHPFLRLFFPFTSFSPPSLYFVSFWTPPLFFIPSFYPRSLDWGSH